MSYAGKININGVDHPIAASLFGVCETAADTAAKIVTLANFDALIPGVVIAIRFTNANTALNPTMNVNGTGAKNIYLRGTTPPGNTAATSWAAGSVVFLIYTGSVWMMHNNQSTELAALDTRVTGLQGDLGTETTRATTAEGALDTAKQNKRLLFTNISVGGKPSATATVAGTGITAATVNVDTFVTQISTSGSYVFSYNGTNWVYGGSTVTLSTYGIEVTGTAANGDTITVSLTVPAAPFVSDPDATYSDYPYRAAVALTGVTEEMVPQVTFDVPEILEDIYAPVAKTYNGGIYLWCASVTESEITVPTILCWE